MSYAYSSAYPRVPNSTPQPPTSIRPPIHNPYDKFTQPQFDEWIGGITGALRKALGQEEDEAPTPQASQPREEDAHSVSGTDEDNIEDSFAEWRAMRAKEKGKMRATENEEDSDYGGSQESYEGTSAQDYTAGNTPGDAIELLSDEDDAEGEQVDDPREYDDEGSDGGSIKGSSPVESDGGVQQPYVENSEPAIPSTTHDFLANSAGREAIEISDGENEDDGQGGGPSDPEVALFGWELEEEGEDQQPPDIRDPWELPRTYAEDLYTGGPIREPDRSKLSPSHLTPATEEADYFDNIDPQLRPPSVPVSQPTDYNLPESPATPAPIPPTTDEIPKGDDESSSCDEDILELDTPTSAAPRDEVDFISFTALNQPSDMDSGQGGPEVLYISDNDGGEVSEDGEEAEDELDDDGPIPLGTSDLEIPAEHELEEDGGEELDELEDDDEPVAEVATNPPYGYYGLDASSVTGSGGLDDETRTVGPPSDPPKYDQGEVPDVGISQESTSLLDPHNLAPLPAATTFIEIDHLPTASVVGDTTNASFVGISLTSPSAVPTISTEVEADNEDVDSADEDSIGDVTIIVSGAVLTVNEVEEVLRGAFAEADQLASITSAQGAVPITDTTPLTQEGVDCTSPKSNLREATPEVFAGEPLPDEPVIKEDEPTPPESPTVKDKLSDSKETQKEPLPFIMPLIANPNVRDPMSAPWSPVQSGPSTPVAGLSYLPAVTKFKRDNQLLGTAHTNSGLFTPLEGSGSSSPSPSDTTTPEDRAGAEPETELLVVEIDEQPEEEQATSVSTSPMPSSQEILEVEPEAVPIGPPEDDDWGEIPRLPTPPAEMVDLVEGALPAGPATPVFVQPVESIGNDDGSGVLTTANHDGDTEKDGAPPAIAEGVPRSNDADPLFNKISNTNESLAEFTETDDPFKLMGNDSTIAPGAVADDNDASSIASSSITSSSVDEEETPRTISKVSESPAPAAEDSYTVWPMHPEIGPLSESLIQAEGSTQGNLKRKRSESIPTDPEFSGSTAGGEVLDAVAAPTRIREHEEACRELTNDEPRNNGEGFDSDTESFASSLIAPRNANHSSQDNSRASSVVSEQPLLRQDHTPVPEDAPVFHGHGKFKTALQALILRRRTSEQNRAGERERETERAKKKDKDQEKPRLVASKKGSRESPGNSSKDDAEAKKPPSLVLPEASTLPSLPSTSTSQSPKTPTSALPSSSPTVVTAPVEVTPSPHQEQTARKPMEPERIQKPVVKAAKRTTSRRYVPVEPKSTRSQCRYRKISLPREEDGPRVTFCVPQCSLNDKELMEEEEITDDGLATVRDFERLWDHVEEQDLNPYLIGVMRQLVGLDLLRENEIYYLPTDEEIKQMERGRQKREERRKNKKSIGGAVDGEGTSVAGRPGSVSAAGPASQPSASQVEKRKIGPPPSFAGSISTTASTRSKVGRGGSTRSASEDEMSDGERGGRAPKRRRRTGKGRDGDGSPPRNTPSVHEDSTALGIAESPAPSQSTTENTPVRRSQRTMKKAISVDTQTYKPPVSSDDESSEGEMEIAKAKRKSARGTTKGLKRRRTEGTVESPLPTPGGAGDRDAALSPRSLRSKRAKIDEK